MSRNSFVSDAKVRSVKVFKLNRDRLVKGALFYRQLAGGRRHFPGMAIREFDHLSDAIRVSVRELRARHAPEPTVWYRVAWHPRQRIGELRSCKLSQFLAWPEYFSVPGSAN